VAVDLASCYSWCPLFAESLVVVVVAAVVGGLHLCRLCRSWCAACLAAIRLCLSAASCFSVLGLPRSAARALTRFRLAAMSCFAVLGLPFSANRAFSRFALAAAF
jgi:hypothetical protein